MTRGALKGAGPRSNNFKFLAVTVPLGTAIADIMRAFTPVWGTCRDWFTPEFKARRAGMLTVKCGRLAACCHF